METSNQPTRIQPAWQKNTRAVVITLRRSTTRAENVKAIIENCPLPCSVWDATDGSLLTADFVAKNYQTGLSRPGYPFTLKSGEIGCYLSHRSLWQKMVDENIQRLLILEDDISFLPNFQETLEHAIEHAREGSYVQFQVRNLSFPEYGVLDQPQATLIRPTLVPLRTSAQLVTLGAAARLLKFSNQFDRPVDASIQMTWEHGAEVLVAVPQSVIEVSASIGGSTIGSKKKRRPLLESIRREWNRARYRQSISKLARQHVQIQRSERSQLNQKTA
jgi:glycosyl transferase, family 25